MALQAPVTVPYCHCSVRRQSLPAFFITHKAMSGGKRLRHFQCSATTPPSLRSSTERRTANYQPTLWSYELLESIKSDHADEIYEERAKKLTKEVRKLVEDKEASPLTVLELIDDVQRLGLGYHFEDEIRKALERVMSLQLSNSGMEKSLHATSLSFRLLRDHGYHVSQDVFKSFKDDSDEFMACLRDDVQGLLSLYEASHLAFEEEELLDEAKAFSTIHLNNLKPNTEKSLAEQVNHVLEHPLHRSMLRLEARWYIDAYARREDANLLLLELAMLDFNMVQSKYQDELKNMSRWWKGIGLANELPFVRDRLTECFFWCVGVASEPGLGRCREGLTKVTTFITIIDDIYDVYGSLDELELFTEAVERWDVDAVKTLPSYMKLCFLALYNTVNEMAFNTLKDKGVNIIPRLTKAWSDLCKAFLVEAKWYYTKSSPTLDSYLDNGWRSVSGVLILVHAYFLTTQHVTEEALLCLDQCHDLLRFPSMIFRLCNDLGTSGAEIERGETANSIVCYMRDTGLSEQLGREHASSLIDVMWKKMNRAAAAESPFEKAAIDAALDLARISQCTYQYGDGHGAPDTRSKNRVLSLIIEPVNIAVAWEMEPKFGQLSSSLA